MAYTKPQTHVPAVEIKKTLPFLYTDFNSCLYLHEDAANGIFMRRTITFKIGKYYYISSRGAGSLNPFPTDADKERFVALLYACNTGQPLISRNVRRRLFRKRNPARALTHIGAWSVTDRGFHLLLRERRVKGISEFMHKLLTAYAMYFNKANARKGALFENRFEAEECQSIEYMQYVFAYIHVCTLEKVTLKWRQALRLRPRWSAEMLRGAWSSLSDYIGIARKEATILERQAFPESLSHCDSLECFLQEWYGFTDSSDPLAVEEMHMEREGKAVTMENTYDKA
jgi:hypothetical protein